jgi:hypothetical protein
MGQAGRASLGRIEMAKAGKEAALPLWRQPDGEPVSCHDKIKVLNENLLEIQEMAQDALEDAILMGCDENQVRAVLKDLMTKLENPYGGKSR